MAIAEIRTPPANLRYRASSIPETEETYLAIGKGGAEAVAEVAAVHQRPLSEMHRILDFGCGCARILQFVHQLVPDVPLFGADVDASAIQWCSENILYASFKRNEPNPPLIYSDEFFDFVFGLSVFSHLDRQMQDGWLREIARVTKPDSLFYFSFSGSFVFEKYKQDYSIANRKEFIEEGFTFVHNIGDGIHPEWYQTSLQTEQYLQEHLPKAWEIVAYKPHGHMGWQDYMLVRRTSAGFES